MASHSEIRADKSFEKNVKDHAVKGGRRTLCISIPGSQVVFSGEENCVLVAQENKKSQLPAFGLSLGL